MTAYSVDEKGGGIGKAYYYYNIQSFTYFTYHYLE
jgi:hypothetical protein